MLDLNTSYKVRPVPRAALYHTQRHIWWTRLSFQISDSFHLSFSPVLLFSDMTDILVRIFCLISAIHNILLSQSEVKGLLACWCSFTTIHIQTRAKLIWKLKGICIRQSLSLTADQSTSNAFYTHSLAYYFWRQARIFCWCWC